MSRSEKDTTVTDEDDVQQQALLLDELPPGYYWSKNFIGSFAATCIMAIGLFTEYSMPTSSLAIINADIGPAPNYVLISTIPSLISGVCLAIVGSLSDIFGRRYFLIAGQTLSLIGSIIAATATSIPQLLGGGVLIGIAASVQNSLIFIIAELVPNKYRPLANGVILGVTLPTAGFGPGFARMIVQNTKQSWRWFYYLSTICAGVSLILFILFYFPPNFQQIHRTSTKRTELKKLDYGGLIMYTGGFIILLLGLSWGGVNYAWTSGHVLGTIIPGILILIVFVFYETFAPLEQTLLPFELLKNRNYVAVLVTCSVATMIYFSMNVIWPQQVAALYTTDNIQIGWLSLPILGTLAAGYSELSATTISSLVCKPTEIGFAVGFLSSMRSISGAIATTIYQTILTNRLNANIPTLVTPPALSANLPSSSLSALFAAIKIGTPEALQAVPGITPTILAAITEPLKTAYSQSFKIVYLTSIAFGGCAIVAACFAKDVDTLMTDQVARRLRGVEVDGGLRDSSEEGERVVEGRVEKERIA
ncbi:MAG: hypothetical protein M1812_003986 [Candelaria pacifica]|nr:MAG: hypothetical protein M1812_003986 [Candelaria pacifica]